MKQVNCNINNKPRKMIVCKNSMSRSLIIVAILISTAVVCDTGDIAGEGELKPLQLFIFLILII